jgi:nucleoside-diphosphate-sugar epimerase
MKKKAKKKILILGGAGYVGSHLSNYLSKKNYQITIYDTCWFGNNLIKNKNLKIIRGDIRKLDKISFKGYYAIIHLANIANDPSVELNPSLSWDVNVFASYEIIKKAIKSKVKKFIYASSGSVYGIKKEKFVTEDLDLKPISTYNRTKMIAERIFVSFSDKIKIYSIRPATVCGISPRMRLDVTVNLLTFKALKYGEMTLFGGNQIRPNININDMSRVYEFFLEKNPKSGFYNAGFENLSIKQIAKKIQEKIPSKIKIKKVFDERSYRQSSSKLLNSGFYTKFSVDDAIDDIIQKFNCGELKDKSNYYTVKWLKHLKII